MTSADPEIDMSHAIGPSRDLAKARPGGSASVAAYAGAGLNAPVAAADLHIGTMGDGTEEQNLGQTGDPALRITAEALHAAFAPVETEAKHRAENEGVATHRNDRGLPDSPPDRHS